MLRNRILVGGIAAVALGLSAMGAMARGGGGFHGGAFHAGSAFHGGGAFHMGGIHSGRFHGHFGGHYRRFYGRGYGFYVPYAFNDGYYGYDDCYRRGRRWVCPYY